MTAKNKRKTKAKPKKNPAIPAVMPSQPIESPAPLTPVRYPIRPDPSRRRVRMSIGDERLHTFKTLITVVSQGSDAADKADRVADRAATVIRHGGGIVKRLEIRSRPSKSLAGASIKIRDVRVVFVGTARTAWVLSKRSGAVRRQSVRTYLLGDQTVGRTAPLPIEWVTAPDDGGARTFRMNAKRATTREKLRTRIGMGGALRGKRASKGLRERKNPG